MWWYMPVVPAQRAQKNGSEIQTSRGYLGKALSQKLTKPKPKNENKASTPT